MSASASPRLLSIGEFAAATQLSPKALRLYAEQHLLDPAAIDPENGYRQYRNDQVTRGRLIRTLRDMDMPLATIARVIAADAGRAEELLLEHLRESEARRAREKRAFHAALLLLRAARSGDKLEVQTRMRPAQTLLVRPFLADRRTFRERLETEIAVSRTSGARTAMHGDRRLACRLIDPLSDEEARLELLVPVKPDASFAEEVTLRHVPATSCAVVAIGARELQSADFSAALDAIFDWFDRQAYRAADAPWLAFSAPDPLSEPEILWAYQSSESP